MRAILIATPLGVFGGLYASSSAALAHVKWFASFQTAEQPVAIGGMSLAVWGSIALVTLAFWAGCYAETTRLGRDFLASCQSITGDLGLRLDELLRGATAVFFGALSAQGGFILTPDLKCTATWMAVAQAAIAMGMFWRQTLPVSALGILVLIVHGCMMYGVFHMLDYAVFLGLTAFFVLLACPTLNISARRFDVLRFGLALSLMWAGVEKWAYPQWTDQVLQAHPYLVLGADREVYIAFAGAVEFGLAFALLWTPAVRCAAALVLALMMAAAIYEFGATDALGHFPIIVILVAVVAERQGSWDPAPSALRSLMFAPVAKGLALVSLAFSYSAAHHWLVGSQPPQVITDVASVKGPKAHPRPVVEARAVQPVRESAHPSGTHPSP
jgi:hypothetical protein